MTPFPTSGERKTIPNDYNPEVVLVDTRLIARAPVRFLVSGMGDALATWLEASSCKAKFAPNITGDVGSMTAYALARLCYDTLLEYGLAAKISLRGSCRNAGPGTCC
jgi:glycerol dehydrogenase